MDLPWSMVVFGRASGPYSLRISKLSMRYRIDDTYISFLASLHHLIDLFTPETRPWRIYNVFYYPELGKVSSYRELCLPL
jgi:hypothetical protein